MASLLEQFFGKCEEYEASHAFDKKALIEALDRNHKGLPEMAETESMQGYLAQFTMQNQSEHWRPTVPLKGLRPIRARELEIDKHHQGRVLFGTLCADAYMMVCITTILEDQYGDAVRLAIDTEGARKLYPKGSKVAVKQPYFKEGSKDGALMLRVDNPQNVEILASFPVYAETFSGKDLLEWRSEGNKYFRDKDWNKAIYYYSRGIDLALSRNKIEPQVPGASNIQENVEEALLYSYSNRAEAKLRLKDYVNALKDCDKALALDHHHLKSLFRKGRAFHYLKEYKLACQWFDRALELSPTAKEVQLHSEKSMELNCQNQQGKFDLSPYFINGCNVSEFSNYIGPVLIKRSVGRGRGLFATDNVDFGDFLLVDNAIAFSSTETTRLNGSPEKVTPSMIESKTKLDFLKVDLDAKIITSATSSPRIFQQLEYLADSDKVKVPPMDLFRINNASWNNYNVCNQRWLFDLHKRAKLMRNVGCQLQTIESNGNMSRHNEQYGLWVLPSFINHSCCPNANCIVVGEAMFIISARKIAAGEEITIPYFDILLPLFARESGFREFKCDCKRCMLERSLVSAGGSPLQEIVKLVYPIDSTLSDLDLCKIAMRVENTIAVLTTEEKQMLRASFFPLYYNIFGLQRIHPSARTTLPSLREVFDGFQEVAPGNCICFELFARSPVYAKNEDETDNVLYQKALEVCTAYMGKHEEGDLKAVLNSVATNVFKPGLTVFGLTEVNLEL